MLIHRKVIVKAIVTEQFKMELLARLRNAKREVELSRQALVLQGRKYLAELDDKDSARADVFRQKLERQLRKRDELNAKLIAEIAAAEALEPETEYRQTDLDGLVEVQLGDNLNDKLGAAEIVARDGVIVEIRNQ
jgi:hypothetical protein